MRSSCELSQKNVAKSLALFTQSIHFYPALVRSLSDGFFCLLICRVASDGALNFLNYSRKAFAIPFSLPPLSLQSLKLTFEYKQPWKTRIKLFLPSPSWFQSWERIFSNSTSKIKNRTN